MNMTPLELAMMWLIATFALAIPFRMIGESWGRSLRYAAAVPIILACGWAIEASKAYAYAHIPNGGSV